MDEDEYDVLDDGTLWRTCWNCGGEGASYHDCGDDSCCCARPRDNVRCDICKGDGGWRCSFDGTVIPMGM